MKLRKAFLVVLCAGAGLTLARCGGASSTPTVTPTPVVPTATPSPTPTPGGGASGLPPGMVCDPTPPPLYKMHVKFHSDQSPERKVLDSKPLVINVDGYCDRVGFGGWKFCDTRVEGDPQREACDYLVTGRALDTGRWGPTWYFNNTLCSQAGTACANHSANQFMAVAKDPGIFVACAAEVWPVAENGERCGAIGNN